MNPMTESMRYKDRNNNGGGKPVKPWNPKQEQPKPPKKSKKMRKDDYYAENS